MRTLVNAQETYDVFGRFARAHLSTSAERGVYLAVVGAPPDEPPTISAISQERGVPVDVVVVVLERFERAGIVEAVRAAGSPTRYRWRADLRYLADSDEDPFRWTDPVCGMPVRADSPYRSRDVAGTQRRFCSTLCLATFEASRPGAAIARTSANGRVGRVA